MASWDPPVSLGAHGRVTGPFLVDSPWLRKQQSHLTLGDPGQGLATSQGSSGGSILRFSEGSKVLWGFLSFFFCLFLDKTSVLPSSSSRARLLRAPPLSLLPSLGLKGRSSGRS